MSNIAKKKDIMELIRWYALHPSQRDAVIPGFVKVALQGKQRDDDPEIIIKAVWEKVTKDSFIEQFVPSFDKVFTHEEIKFLLNYYKSDVAKKFIDNGNLFNQIFEGFNAVILGILEKSPKGS